MDTYSSYPSNRTLGSGQVESDPEKRIIHFGSPDEDLLPPHPDPVPEPAPTAEPEPQVFGPQPQKPAKGSFLSRWFR
jgi:hypothetical protein